MAIIRITDLELRTLVGINDWEKTKKQDVILNIALEYDAAQAAESDDIADTVDYKAIKDRIVEFVESARTALLEKLAAEVLKIVMADPKVLAATVRIDKPQALRYAKSVSVELSQKHNAP